MSNGGSSNGSYGEDNEDTLGFEKVVEFNKRKHKVEGVRYCKSNLLCRVKQELSFSELQLTEIMFANIFQASLIIEDIVHAISVEDTAEQLGIDIEYARQLWKAHYPKLASIQHHIADERRIINIIEQVHYDAAQGKVFYKFTNAGRDILSGTKPEFETSLRKHGYIQKHKGVLKASGKYTNALYELLKVNTWAKTDYTIMLTDLRHMLNIPDSYTSTARIGEYIIKPSLREIHELTGETYKYSFSGRRKRADRIIFKLAGGF